MRAVITERAAPKVNLTLSVLGRRPDGYHELESLVAFARDIADVVTLTPGPDPAVHSLGRFAPSIAGENLLDVTLHRIASSAPGLTLGSVELEKNLPVAAGIGGGSADAAALIRAVIRANPADAPIVDWLRIATSIGADVPACLAASPQLMAGIGERLTPMPALPALDALLVNPLLPVPPDKTARVFRTLGAGPLPASPPARRTPEAFPTRDALLAHMRATGNDLTRPAIEVVPEIADVLAVLSTTPGCALAQLSGGGPTCFAIFEDAAAAREAARVLAAARPGWWIAPSRLS